MAERGLLRRAEPSANGDGAVQVRSVSGLTNVRATGTGRQRRLPWVALGVLLLVMSILGFALWSVAQASRTPVLVAKNDIQPGTEITRDDLMLVNVGADSGLELMAAGDEELVVGRVARGPIPAGTPLSEALVVSESEAVPEGTEIVGTTLAPGEYPTPDIQSGDRVRVIETANANATTPEQEEVLGIALLWSVVPMESSTQEELFISLAVPAEVATAVGNADAEDRLRLSLVGAES